MLSTSQIALFCIASVPLILTPGPDMLYIIARSLGQGKVAGIVSALGVSFGILVHTSAAAIGLSTVLMSSALAYNIIKYTGAAYLIYLGIRTIISREQENNFNLHQAGIGLAKTFSQGVLSNVLNPKVALFFLAFLPQFVDPNQGEVGLQIVSMGLILFIMGFSFMVLVVLLTSHLGNRLQSYSRWRHFQQWFTGSILVFLGARLAFSEQK